MSSVRDLCVAEPLFLCWPLLFWNLAEFSCFFQVLSSLELVFHLCISWLLFLLLESELKMCCFLSLLYLFLLLCTFEYYVFDHYAFLALIPTPSFFFFCFCLMLGSPTSPDHKTKRQSDPTPFGFKGTVQQQLHTLLVVSPHCLNTSKALHRFDWL